jgi:ABC-type transport system involved in multi-copper enzyme maturation permease subunit
VNSRNAASTAIVLAAIVRDTFEEARARWLFWGLFGLSTLIILFFLFALSIDLMQGAQATVEFGSAPARTVWNVQRFVTVAYAWIAPVLYIVTTLLAVFASAGLTPVLLEQGRIGLLLSKPISRPLLPLGRYLGNVLIILCNSTYLIGSVWLILASKTRVWDARFLIAIPCSVFVFAVLLSVVVLIGVLFESAALSIMAAVALMLISTLLAQREWADKLLSSEFSRDLWTALYWIVPKVLDVGISMHDFILKERTVEWGQSIWSSALFAAAMLAIALGIFQKRDY